MSCTDQQDHGDSRAPRQVSQWHRATMAGSLPMGTCLGIGVHTHLPRMLPPV